MLKKDILVQVPANTALHYLKSSRYPLCHNSCVAFQSCGGVKDHLQFIVGKVLKGYLLVKVCNVMSMCCKYLYGKVVNKSLVLKEVVNHVHVYVSW